METLVRTPQLIFMQPQRLLVPLFQRPYVWNEESQWEPLWDDVTRVAHRVVANRDDRHQPHFLGAVVLQQVQNSTGHLQARTIIDGQQRLTTLQLMLDALHGELVRVGAAQPAMRIEALVRNPDAFCVREEDQFKVWPTNRDRRAFMAVMAAPTPVRHEALTQAGERLVEAHRYFSEQARTWLEADGEDGAARAQAIEKAVRELLQLVVIDLGADENAQEIFRDAQRARGTTDGGRPDQELRVPAAERGRRGRAASVRGALAGVRNRLLGDRGHHGSLALPAIVGLPQPLADLGDGRGDRRQGRLRQVQAVRRLRHDSPRLHHRRPRP